MKDAIFIVLTDSVGNEPEGETAKFYVLKSEKYTTYYTFDYLFKNSKQTIHYRRKTSNISVKIINIVYCKTRWEITPVFVCDI